MSLIKVALSHYCCRTTLQWQCHEIVLKLSVDRVRQLKQYSLEFAAEGEQGRHVPDMTRQRIPGSCCSRRKLRICFLRLSCCGFFALLAVRCGCSLFIMPFRFVTLFSYLLSFLLILYIIIHMCVNEVSSLLNDPLNRWRTLVYLWNSGNTGNAACGHNGHRCMYTRRRLEAVRFVDWLLSLAMKSSRGREMILSLYNYFLFETGLRCSVYSLDGEYNTR